MALEGYMSEYERLISKWNPRLGYGGPRYVDTPINGVCKGYGVRSALQEYWYIYVRMLAQATKECFERAEAVRKIKDPTPEQQIVRYRMWTNHQFQGHSDWGLENSVHIMFFNPVEFPAGSVSWVFSLFEQSLMIPSTASGDAPSPEEFFGPNGDGYAYTRKYSIAKTPEGNWGCYLSYNELKNLIETNGNV